MAKKKSIPQEENCTKNQEQIHQMQTPAVMDEASDKLRTLKSLNAMLLKETVERRQQVDSLLHANEVLETKLTRVESERKGLEAELTRFGDEGVKVEVERGLVSEFVAVQVGERVEVIEKGRDGFWREKMEGLEREMERVLSEKSEIEKARVENESEIRVLEKRLGDLVADTDKERAVLTRVSRQKDEIRAQLDAQIEEANGLRVKLIEAERREVEIEREMEKLKADCDGIVEEKEEGERRIESILREKDFIERSLVESNRVISETKREIEEMVREKEAIEEAKNVEERKNIELAGKVCGLNELVASLTMEEKTLQGKVAEMVKRCDEGLEKEMEMGLEIDGLVKEKKEMEKNFESLIEKKGLLEKDLDEAMKNLDQQKVIMEQMSSEKMGIEEAKSQGESEMVELKKQLGEYSVTIQSLEESGMRQSEKLKQLDSDVSEYRAAFDQATIERNEAREGLAKEISSGMKLIERLSVMEKEIEELHKEFRKMEAENGKLRGEKNELKDGCKMLTEDIVLMENKLSEVRKEYNDMKAKVAVADANSKQVLNLLKNTAALIGLSKEDERCALNEGRMVSGEENGIGEEMKQYVVELEGIKKAVQSRESKIEELKRELESLGDSVAREHKGKSFWTMVSSATTILAAASLAYVVRAH